MFLDRADAGRRLAEKLAVHRSEIPVVVALPRGGVPIGFEVARALRAPLDVLMVRKIGYPGQPEYAIGAVADGVHHEVLLNTELFNETELPAGYLEGEIAAKLEQIREMTSRFRRHRRPVPLADRVVIVVDDGIATGATMRVVLRRVRAEDPAEIIVAAPVMSAEAFERLKKEADVAVCLEAPRNFHSVSDWYSEFRQVSDDEVIQLLDRARASGADHFSPGISYR